MTPAELSKFVALVRQLQQGFSKATNPMEKQEILGNFSYYLQSKMGRDLLGFYQEVYPGFTVGSFTFMMVDDQLPQLLEGFYKRRWETRQDPTR